MLGSTTLVLVAYFAGAGSSQPTLPVTLETRTALDSALTNIHVQTNAQFKQPISITYGSCDAKSPTKAHQVADVTSAENDYRLIWKLDDHVNEGGCLSAWDASHRLVGRSIPQIFHEKLRKKRALEKRGNAIAMNRKSGIDVFGPWFDGVKLLKNKEIAPVDVKKAKSKKIAIVGAGMAGLMSYLILHQAGFKNVTLIEANDRLGGRIHTEYLSGGPSDYSYQEMGPMRLPLSTTIDGETLELSDQKIILQVIDEMNKFNGNSSAHKVNLIPWIQSSDNGLVYMDEFKLPTGYPPTQGEIAQNSSLLHADMAPESAVALGEKYDKTIKKTELMKKIIKDMFHAHSEYLKNGADGMPGDQWSEFAFMVNYLKANVSDASYFWENGLLEAGNLFYSLYDGIAFDLPTNFKTIDQGMNRLPLSFQPLVANATRFKTAVNGIRWNEKNQTVTLKYKDNKPADNFDYTMISSSFSVVQKWRIPRVSHTLRTAIDSLRYESACKIALEYKTRFWEHLPKPIYGSCATQTDIPGIGTICYPSYNLNSTGPASILASYLFATSFGQDWSNVDEKEHVQMTLDAMVEIHGDVAREQYTGNYKRKCWFQDPYTQSSWAEPTVGQHELFLPEYFTTHKHMIFIGEHTAYTHGWIASALESGIRGSVQLMLELGLVDEAKAVVDKWMARWVTV